MQKRQLGRTGYQVSAVIYGGIVSGGEGQPASDRYVGWAIDHGINYFDVAPTYGDAEERLGSSLKPYRHEVYLACKTMERRREGAKRDIERSMALLHTDYFDVFQLHAMTTPEDIEVAFGPGGTMELLRDLKQKGVLRKVSFSAHNERAALELLKRYPFDTVLFPMNFALDMDQGIGRDLAALKKEKGFGLLGMKSIIERAWVDEKERENSPYPKSWCKPFGITDRDLRLAAMKYTLAMGSDVLVPPGNYESFKFMVDHIDEALAGPPSQAEEAMLAERLKLVRDRPFFVKNNGGWES
ncbi:MAG: aldo/keto reductase [Christensenellales bacterium]